MRAGNASKTSTKRRLIVSVIREPEGQAVSSEIRTWDKTKTYHFIKKKHFTPKILRSGQVRNSPKASRNTCILMVRNLYGVPPSPAILATLEQYLHTKNIDIGTIITSINSNILIFLLFTALLFLVEAKNCLISWLRMRSEAPEMTFLEEAQPGECVALFGDRSETSSIIMEITRKFCSGRTEQLYQPASPKLYYSFCSGRSDRGLSLLAEPSMSESNGDWIVSKFRPTPVLAPYLLAIFVSDFDYDEMYTRRGVRFRLWSSPYNKDTRQNGLKAAVMYMELFEEYFGVQDIVMKQDMVGVADFSEGAMENWGLMTFRDDIVPSNFGIVLHPETIHGGKATIAHELAHQWFGNMVTLKSWGELWLNEGFASYFERTKLYREVGSRLRRHDRDIEEALEADSYWSTRPLSATINSPSEVKETFDTISYRKGEAIITMAARLIDEQHFRRALNHYIKKFSNQTARGDDFWKALDETAAIGYEGPDGGTLKMWHFGSQWTKQIGFPLVTVMSLNSTTVEIRQEKYVKIPYVPVLRKHLVTDYGYKWDVPLLCQRGNGKIEFKWLRKEESLYINIGRGERPIVINVDRRGYFRQNYDAEGWEDMVRQLKEDHENQYCRPANCGFPDFH
ncbi:hypothetical protein Y032_0284g1344 [Ancylostoma ceylanicum]|uniref:Peptidase M1 membrane alanine aminopeptidase domain-containing protein n=1 Tax=Ancylostoma ceylanicum TaxID=53326 RepID=A0A016S6T3_9BILA|nr:hypothetical protein Y032_0284g1344 [Ancylostoma ceylanicum]